MVRLLLLDVDQKKAKAASFNSSMVRLLLYCQQRYYPNHHVSIPQWYDYYFFCTSGYACLYGFQFLNGTIITLKFCRELRSRPSFNSSMVRLLRLSCAHVSGGNSSFNSSMVRLLQGSITQNTVTNKVSIPQWYDYYKVCFTATLTGSPGFNSSMVRLLLSGRC